MANFKKVMMASAGGGGYWIADYQSLANNYSYAYWMDFNSSGNVVTTGRDQDSSYPLHVGIFDVSDGSNLDYARINEDNLRPECVFADSSDNYYITGWRDDGSGNNERSRAFKLDSSLAYQWGRENYASFSSSTTRIWGGTFNGTNIFMCGQTGSGNQGFYLSYDTSGTLRYDYGVTTNYNKLRGATFLGSKQYYVGKSEGTTNDPAYFFGVTDNYTASPEKHYDGGGGYYTNGNNLAARGSNIYLAGNYYSPRRAFVLKLDTSGNVTWDRQINENAQLGENTTHVAVDSSDNVYLVYSGYNAYDTRICKLNSSGTLQWSTKLTHSSGSAISHNVQIDSNDDLFVCGQNSGAFPDSSSSSAWIAKLPNDGSGTGTYGDWTYATFSTTATANGNLVVSNTNQYVTDVGGRSTGSLTKSVSGSSPAYTNTETL